MLTSTKQQIGSVAHPLRAGRRRLEPERGPIRIVVIRHQEQRRQDRADGPFPIGPAVRINERMDMDPVEIAAMESELRSAGRRGMGAVDKGRIWATHRSVRRRVERRMRRWRTAGRAGRRRPVERRMRRWRTAGRAGRRRLERRMWRRRAADRTVRRRRLERRMRRRRASGMPAGWRTSFFLVVIVLGHSQGRQNEGENGSKSETRAHGVPFARLVKTHGRA